MLRSLIDPSFGFYLNLDISEQDVVRQNGSFIERLETRLMNRVFHSKLGVRGKYTATDSVVESILREGKAPRYELFTEQAHYSAVEERATKGWQIPRERVRVHPLSSLLGNFDGFSLGALLVPQLSAEPFRIRNAFASRMVPIITLSHGFSLHSMLYDVFLKMCLSGMQPYDSIVCTSRASEEAMARIFANVLESFNAEYGLKLTRPARIDRIPLCIDTELFFPHDKQASRKRFNLHRNTVVMLYVGRVSTLKADLMPLIFSFSRLLRDNPGKELLLMIAGSPDMPHVQALHSLLKQLGITRNVRFLFNFPDADKAALYSAADIFVAPADSMLESFGVSVLEAMSCGLPQVVADWNGYRDTVVDGETGFLIPTYWSQCDEDMGHTGIAMGWSYDHYVVGQTISMDGLHLQSSLQLLIDNEDLRLQMSHASRQRAEASYNYRVSARRYELLGDELTELAQGVLPPERIRHFDEPRYFKSFEKHATRVLTGQDRVALTSLSQEQSGRWLLSQASPVGDAVAVGETDIFQRLLAICHRRDLPAFTNSAGASPALLISELIDEARWSPEESPAPFMRAVMWLIKMGYLQVIQQAG